MGRTIAGGIFGQPPVVGGRATVTGLDITAPDTSLDLAAAVIRQNDPGQSVIQRWQDTAGTDVMKIEADGTLTISGSLGTASSSTNMTNDEIDLLLQGELVQIVATGARRVARALATSLGTVDVFGAVQPAAGIASGAAGAIRYAGLATVRLVAGLVGMDEGQRVYVSAATAGRGTTTAPDASGQVAAEIGVITDVIAYDGAANLTVQVMIDKKSPVRFP